MERRFEILATIEATREHDRVLARHRGPGPFERLVVLKRFAPLAAGERLETSAAMREAWATKLLAHPGVVRLLDFDLLDGRPTLVLEHVEGLTVEAARARLAVEDRALPDAAAIAIVHAIFATLAAAHGARDPATGEFRPLVHGALSPAHVHVTWGGDVKLGDFRVASVGGAVEPPRTETFFARDAYVAPEQVQGEPITVRTDVFRAALVAYELLARAGELDARAAAGHLHGAARATLAQLRPDLPRPVCDAIQRGLEASPERRSASAGEIAEAIAARIDVAQARRVLAGTMETLWRTTRRSIHDDPDTTAVVPFAALEGRPIAPDAETVPRLPDLDDRASSTPPPAKLETARPVALEPIEAPPLRPAGRRRAIVVAAAAAVGLLAIAVVRAASMPASGAAAGTGFVDLTPDARDLGARIDGRPITEARVELPCGPHTVTIAGAARPLDVPCGGAVTVAP